MPSDRTPERILVFGAGGMLGHKLVQRLAPRFDVVAAFRAERVPQGPAADAAFAGARPLLGVDVERPGALEEAIGEVRPDVVLNAVGVVKQLAAAHDPLASIAINALLPHRLAAACRALSPAARLIHFSTDCVFSGRRGPYAQDAEPDALDLYGRSKLLGEVAEPHCLTIRSSIIGRELRGHVGLIEWFMRQRGGTAKGFANALYTGLTTIEMADLVGRLITEHPDLHGVWQVASRAISKYDLLQIVNRVFALGVDLSRDEAFHCDRRLDGRSFAARTGYEAPSWEAMIEAMRADPTPYDPKS